MTVAQLIEDLRTLRPDLPVLVSVHRVERHEDDDGTVDEEVIQGALERVQEMHLITFALDGNGYVSVHRGYDRGEPGVVLAPLPF